VLPAVLGPEQVLAREQEQAQRPAQEQGPAQEREQARQLRLARRRVQPGLRHHHHRRRHLGVDLVGRHFEQRLVLSDHVTDLLEPLSDGALGDRFAELGKNDVCHGESLLK
jgi:hypothetical protein